jgi:carboxynorspermidine decarboxylase
MPVIDFSALKNIPTTPAFVLDKARLTRSLDTLRALSAASGCKVLYSLKALPFSAVLQWTRPYVEGFSVSSMFEARLAEEFLGGAGQLHLTTPGLKAGDIEELGALCSHVNFNSLSHYRRFAPLLPKTCSPGLRVNPKLSFLSDDRFNPCRLHSKLGADIAELQTSGIPEGIEGLHVHTIFSSTTLLPLQQTVAQLREVLHPHLATLQWLNLGGGYLFDRIGDVAGFADLVYGLKKDYGLEIFIEPGKAVVGEAGFLVAEVVDRFVSDGEYVAVLDSSVNHHPELFEYQRSADLAAPQPGAGDHKTILAGCTCLAGDLFGTYRLREPVAVGDKVVFKSLGAYSLIKANRFNGYNLPDIYAFEDGKLQLLKHYTYRDYRGQWLAESQPEDKP